MVLQRMTRMCIASTLNLHLLLLCGSAGLPLTETAYTALARMAASAGDGVAALAAAQAMVAAGLSPRLRSFTPALLAFSTAGQVQSCLNSACAWMRTCKFGACSFFPHSKGDA